MINEIAKNISGTEAAQVVIGVMIFFESPCEYDVVLT
jgi:hypothetical protein